MKYKVAFLFIATALFIGFYFVHPVEAMVLNENQTKTSIIISRNGNNYVSWQTGGTRTVYLMNDNGNYYLSNYNNYSSVSYTYLRDNTITNPPYYDDNFYSYSGYIDSYIIVGSNVTLVKNGNELPGSFDSWEAYENYLNPPPDPTWWDNVKTAFLEFTASPAMGAVLSGDWLGYINEVLFGELWSVQVGEGEDELEQFYTVSATPSPSPIPTPTQIPVQINIDPTTGNVMYHYTIDVSGTPVPTSSPVNPNPPAGTGGVGSELTEPFGVTDYYEPDDSLSIPNLRIFQFLLDLPGSNTDIGVDSLDNNVEVMNGYLEDNADAITTVSSFFQVIPSDWFLLLGAIACFPIIAAMIKSLLGG